MEDYDKKVEENKKRNEKFINEFGEWLNSKNLVKKTIKKHIGNIDFYINDYLVYYEIIKMEEGMNEVYSFFKWLVYRKMYVGN